jgi:hypothetical protein
MHICWLASPLLLLPLAGCLASVQNYLYPRVEMVDTTAGDRGRGCGAAAAAVATGSIFNSADLPAAVRGPSRAPGRRHADGADRREGQASAKSTSSVDKNGSIEAGITALPWSRA